MTEKCSRKTQNIQCVINMSSAVGNHTTPPFAPLPPCGTLDCFHCLSPAFRLLTRSPRRPCATRLQSNFIYLPFFGKVFLSAFCCCSRWVTAYSRVVPRSPHCRCLPSLSFCCVCVCVLRQLVESPLQAKEKAAQGRARQESRQVEATARLAIFCSFNYLFNACL